MNNFINTLKSIPYFGMKITAVFFAVYFFFVGLSYGDEPVKIEMTATVSEVEIIPDATYFQVDIDCKNVGRPFQEESPVIISINVYKEENGEKKYIDAETVYSPGYTLYAGIYETGDEFSHREIVGIYPDAEPGVYDMSINMYGCTQVFENAITIE